MEITGISSVVTQKDNQRIRNAVNSTLRSTSEEIKQNAIKPAQQAEDLEKLRQRTAKAMEEIQKIGEMFDRKLQFSVNKEIDRVVVKVIDANTNKVVREIPAEEIQKLQTRIREALGLLFDERV